MLWCVVLTSAVGCDRAGADMEEMPAGASGDVSLRKYVAPELYVFRLR